MSRNFNEILKNLHSRDPNVRESALDEVGTLNPENALEIILPFLSDPDPEVRSTAACNLGEIDNQKAIPHLIETVRQDDNEWVRYHALESLSEYHSPQILSSLLDEVYHGSSSRKTRVALATQLGQYDSEEAVDALLTLLQVDDSYVLTTAAGSLFKLNRPRVRNVWQDLLLTAFHPYLCQTATQALAELEHTEPFDVVYPFLTSQDSTIRQGAAFALAHVHDERAIPLLIQQAREDRVQEVQDMAIFALGNYHRRQIGSYLIEAMSHQSLSARAKEWIAEQLGSYDCEESVNALLSLLQDENEIIRSTALYSLSQLNRPRLRPIWQSLLKQYPDHSYKRELIEKALAELKEHDTTQSLASTDQWLKQKGLFEVLGQRAPRNPFVVAPSPP
ncbi:MAG: HEAT repeat domain-containing protein [Ardenticatenaceae bacterium]